MNTIAPFLTTLLGCFWLCLPGLFIYRLLSKTTSLDSSTHLLVASILNLTSTPLLLFWLHQGLSLPITPLLTIITHSLFSLTLAIICFTLSPPSFSRLSIPRIKLHHLLFLFCLTIGSAILSYFLFLSHQPLPGPDSSAYLFNSAQIVSTGTIPRNLDRSIVFLIPAILSYTTPFSVYHGLKIMVFTLFTLSGISVYLLARKFFSLPISLVAMMMTFFNPGLVRLSAHIFAFLFAALVVNTIILLIFNSLKYSPVQVRRTTLIIFWFWGLIFNLHGILAFGSLLIIGLPVAGYIYLHRKNLLRPHLQSLSYLCISVVLFIISSLPLAYTGWSFVYRGVVMPIFRIGLDAPIPADPNHNITGVIRSNIINPQHHQIQLPAIRSYYLEIHSPLVMFLSTLGILGLIHQQRKTSTSSPFTPLVLLWTLGYFLVTQQQYLGVDWYSGRFVLSMYPLIIIFFIFGLDRLLRVFNINLFHLPVIWQLVLLMLPYAPALNRSLNYYRHQYQATISQPEFDFYRQLSAHIRPPHSAIFYSGSNHYWLMGLNPHLNIHPVDNDHICNPVYKSIGKLKWNLTQAFCDHTSLEDSITTLSDIAGSTTYYVVIQTSSTTADVSKFFNSSYQTLVQTQAASLLHKL